jgi:hypothetical protein
MKAWLTGGLLIAVVLTAACEDGGTGVASGPVSENSGCAVTDNLVRNCGFDDDAAGWLLFNVTSWQHVASDGKSGPGSIEIVQDPSDPFSLGQIRQCITIASNVTYEYRMAARVVSGNADVCEVAVTTYANPSCSAPADVGPLVESFRPGTIWVDSPTGLVTAIIPADEPEGARSVLLSGACRGVSLLTFRLDDFFLVEQR